jgi:hypothetical protein
VHPGKISGQVPSLPSHAFAVRAVESCWKPFRFRAHTRCGRLLGIVNEILRVESCPEDVSQLPSFEEQPPVDLACASCGGEIFQTAFSCEGTCLRDDIAEASNGNKVVICPLCFVDGRTCSCGGMRPLRVREMGPLIKARDMVHDFIRGVAEKFLISKTSWNLLTRTRYSWLPWFCTRGGSTTGWSELPTFWRWAELVS